MTKKAKSEIDALFSKVKKPKAKPVVEKKPEKAPKGSAADPLGKGQVDVKVRKRTEEGWPIYTEEELKLGNEGGDTADCPFDCQCCF